MLIRSLPESSVHNRITFKYCVQGVVKYVESGLEEIERGQSSSGNPRLGWEERDREDEDHND